MKLLVKKKLDHPLPVVLTPDEAEPIIDIEQPDRVSALRLRPQGQRKLTAAGWSDDQLASPLVVCRFVYDSEMGVHCVEMRMGWPM